MLVNPATGLRSSHEREPASSALSKHQIRTNRHDTRKHPAAITSFVLNAEQDNHLDIEGSTKLETRAVSSWVDAGSWHWEHVHIEWLRVRSPGWQPEAAGGALLMNHRTVAIPSHLA
ncbi:hypothetical protein ON010_g14367 [Phytophthora cinnamomi]|nr:hypothetical protein ON010_g14367 [Phytophthora cinnamomi]